jgi:hypothetical protein
MATPSDSGSYLPKDGGFPAWEQLDQDACLVKEALCRVIAGAKRFQTIIEAWRALCTVERLRREIDAETTRYFSGGGCQSGAAAMAEKENQK